jgi:hypothetical protein
MQNLEIQFNGTIIKQVKALNFQVDQLGSVLFILFSLYENRLDLLDEFDDFNLQKRAILLYKELEVRNLVEKNENEDKDQSHFVLTKEGMEFVEFIKAEFSKQKEQITSEDIAVSGVESLKEGVVTTSDDVEAWIDEWVDIFPRGVKSGGRLIRSDKASCLRKMKVFLREYDYDRETIMKATKAYMDSKRQENYAYCRCAVYFIYRVDTSRSDKISDLASWCDQVKHEKEQGNSESTENNLEIMV